MESLPIGVSYGLQETNDVSAAWMDEEMQPLKAVKIKRTSGKD